MRALRNAKRVFSAAEHAQQFEAVNRRLVEELAPMLANPRTGPQWAS